MKVYQRESSRENDFKGESLLWMNVIYRKMKELY